jgi:hypothetical protein
MTSPAYDSMMLGMNDFVISLIAFALAACALALHEWDVQRTLAGKVSARRTDNVSSIGWTLVLLALTMVAGIGVGVL